MAKTPKNQELVETKRIMARLAAMPHKPHKSPASSKKPAASKPKALELDPDAWPKFEALVKSAAKMGHKPHYKIAPPKKAKPNAAK